jgi:hypothetical protein
MDDERTRPTTPRGMARELASLRRSVRRLWTALLAAVLLLTLLDVAIAVRLVHMMSHGG